MAIEEKGMASLHRIRYLFPIVLLGLILLALLAACAQTQQDPAGTSTQDPPIPQLTQATHGILDTTGTVTQSFLDQLRSRSDDVQFHGFQIGAVFFNNLASDPHQFATQVFNTNGIGYKDTNNGVLFVLYLQKAGTDGHAPWLSYITGGGISGSLPDTLMDDYVQTSFVPARAQGQWQNGLLAFYDKVSAAERDPNIAQEWQTAHPISTTTGSQSSDTGSNSNPVEIAILVTIGIVIWLVLSAVVAARRRENFFYTAFRLLGRIVFILVLFGRNSSGGSSRKSGLGSWGGGGRSPSSGGDV